MLDVRVCCGAVGPLVRESVICPEVHGESGLDGGSVEIADELVDKIWVDEGKAVNVTFESIVSHGEPVTIIATGALTNIALLLIVYPESRRFIKEIVLMGGAIGLGNTGPHAEFNIQVDPEAARVVFNSGVKVTMVPLEVTHTALVTADVLTRINALGEQSGFVKLMRELLVFFSDTYRTVFNFPDPPLHDPCAVLYVLDPTLFEERLMRVDVECGSDLTYGTTLCDVYNMSGKEKNVHVCSKMNVEAFWSAMIAALGEANAVSPLNPEARKK